MIDDLVHAQLIATAELAIVAVQAGLRDTVLVYVPGDAPYVTRSALRGTQICTDGRGTFDLWQTEPQLEIAKNGLSLADAVAALRDPSARAS